MSYGQVLRETSHPTGWQETLQFISKFDADLDVKMLIKQACVQAQARYPEHMIANMLPQKVVLEPRANYW